MEKGTAFLENLREDLFTLYLSSDYKEIFEENISNADIFIAKLVSLFYPRIFSNFKLVNRLYLKIQQDLYLRQNYLRMSFEESAKYFKRELWALKDLFRTLLTFSLKMNEVIKTEKQKVIDDGNGSFIYTKNFYTLKDKAGLWVKAFLSMEDVFKNIYYFLYGRVAEYYINYYIIGAGYVFIPFCDLRQEWGENKLSNAVYKYQHDVVDMDLGVSATTLW